MDDRPVISRRRYFPVKYKAIKDDRERKSFKVSKENNNPTIEHTKMDRYGWVPTYRPKRVFDGTIWTDDWFFQRREAHPGNDKRTRSFLFYLASKHVRLVTSECARRREADGWKVESRLKLSNPTNPQVCLLRLKVAGPDRRRRKDAKPELPIDWFNLPFSLCALHFLDLLKLLLFGL